MTGNAYTNRQDSPMFFFVALLAVGCVVGGVLSAPEMGAQIACWVLFALFGVVAFAFKWLETSDKGDHLLLRFGPFPIARRRLNYAAVRSVKQDRALIIEGWGIHLGPRGWIWNIWGRQVVEVELDKGRLRIGTNDPEGLIACLRERCALD